MLSSCTSHVLSSLNFPLFYALFLPPSARLDVSTAELQVKNHAEEGETAVVARCLMSSVCVCVCYFLHMKAQTWNRNGDGHTDSLWFPVRLWSFFFFYFINWYHWIIYNLLSCIIDGLGERERQAEESLKPVIQMLSFYMEKAKWVQPAQMCARDIFFFST